MTPRRAALGKTFGMCPPKDRAGAHADSPRNDAHWHPPTAHLHRLGVASKSLFPPLRALQLRTCERRGGNLILTENCCRSSRRLSRHLLRGLTDKAVPAVDETFNRLTEVLEQVEAVGNLHCLWRTISCALGISRRSVSTDDLDAGV